MVRSRTERERLCVWIYEKGEREREGETESVR